MLNNALEENSLSREFNNQKYNFKVVFWNPETDPVVISPELVISLVIEENLFHWPTMAELVINNQNQFLERTFQNQLSQNQIRGIKFRNDGRDFVRIIIQPHLEDTLLKGLIGSNTQPDPRYWNLDFTFVIYNQENVEDVPDNNFQLKKLFLRDHRYQQLLDRKLEYSTGLQHHHPNVELVTSQQSLYETNNSYDLPIKPLGLVIQDLLIQSGLGPWVPSIDQKLELPGKTISSTTPAWELGPSNYFSCNPQHTAWEDLSSALDAHFCLRIGDGGEMGDIDPSLFISMRTPFPGEGDITHGNQFHLLSLQKIFALAGNSPENPGGLQTFHFFIDETANSQTDNRITPFRSPNLNILDYNRDLKLNAFSTIYQYNFVDVAGKDNTDYMINRAIHAYDFNEGQFVIENERHNVDYALQYVKDSYLKNLYGKDVEPGNVINLNLPKIEGDITNHIYVPYGGDVSHRASQGLNKMILSMLFLGSGLKFQCLGLPVHTIGHFVALDRTSKDPNEENYLDDKLLGQWFTVRVRHIFHYDNYTNEIIAVKTNAYQNLHFDQLVS